MTSVTLRKSDNLFTNLYSKTTSTAVLIGSCKASASLKTIFTDFLSSLIFAFGVETDFIFFGK
ncbi:hypothetical protein RCH19_000112 [Flavobacterium sp. PL12]